MSGLLKKITSLNSCQEMINCWMHRLMALINCQQFNPQGWLLVGYIWDYRVMMYRYASNQFGIAFSAWTAGLFIVFVHGVHALKGLYIFSNQHVARGQLHITYCLRQRDTLRGLSTHNTHSLMIYSNLYLLQGSCSGLHFLSFTLKTLLHALWLLCPLTCQSPDFPSLCLLMVFA